jgi:DNA-binding transcriptional LysR family regulator
MLEGLTLDQLRIFVAATEARSFSAAGRKLNRAQSVISQSIANLEGQLGVALFRRDGHYPELTPEGEVLLTDAKATLSAVATMKARARQVASGLETEVGIAADVLFPMSILTKTAAAFGEEFPLTPLRLYVEALGGVAKSVLNRQCQFGIMAELPFFGTELHYERLLAVEIVLVAGANHPLALQEAPLTQRDLAQHVQLVVTDRTDLSLGRDFRVLSPRIWRLSDLCTKHAFLLAALGWGWMPTEMVRRDLNEGRLRELRMVEFGSREHMVMATTYRSGAPPGPAGRWFLERLRHFAEELTESG